MIPPVEEERLDELGGKLGAMAKRGVSNISNSIKNSETGKEISDRFKVGLGNAGINKAEGGRASGRMDLRYAVKKLSNAWHRFAGREENAGNKTIVRRPTVQDLADWLEFDFGVQLPDGALGKALQAGAAKQPQP